MPGSLTAKSIKDLLLGGGITGPQLDTKLSDPATLGKYRAMMLNPLQNNIIINHPVAKGIILQSGVAFSELTIEDVLAIMQNASDVKTIASSTSTLLSILYDADIYDAIRNDVGSSYTNLKAQVNAAGSKLKRDILTTSGSFAFHSGNTLAGLSIAVVSGGGAGGEGTPSISGGAAGGASSLDVLIVDEGSLPSSNTSYVIGSGAVYGGASATNSNFGAFATSSFGASAVDNNPGTGGGSNSNESSTLIDGDILGAPWQGDTSTIQGKTGATPTGTGSNGFDGTGAGVGGTASTSSGAGTSPGASGGGGWNMQTGNYPGGDAVAPNYGASGGGAARPTSGSVDGGDGAPGVIVAYYVIN